MTFQDAEQVALGLVQLLRTRPEALPGQRPLEARLNDLANKAARFNDSTTDDTPEERLAAFAAKAVATMNCR